MSSQNIGSAVSRTAREQSLTLASAAAQVGPDEESPDAQYGEGVLEIVDEGFGFLRAASASFAPGPDDIYVSPTQIRRFRLQTGHCIRGVIRPPVGTDRYHGLMRIDSVNGLDPESLGKATKFDDLVAVYPRRRIRLQADPDDLTTRIIDLMAPIGLGQRMLIATPARNSEAVLLRQLANAIVRGCPEAVVTVLVIDARPEDVSGLRQNTDAEVVASTFEEPAGRHVRIAEMAMQKARRHVELGQDAVVLIDSLTRLALAYHEVAEETADTGKVLSCGLKAEALDRVRRLFGAARDTQGAGSLTILAAAANTGSAIDRAIFEELEEAANAQLRLDRRLGENYLAPGVDIAASATCCEKLLRDPDELEQVRRLRRALGHKSPLQAIELLMEQLGATATNAQFIQTLSESDEVVCAGDSAPA